MVIRTKISILNIKIRSFTQKELLEQMAEGVLYTPNLDHLIKLQRDREFYDIYQQAEWIVCDSQILYLASKLLKRSLPMAIPGSSFFTAFYNINVNVRSECLAKGLLCCSCWFWPELCSWCSLWYKKGNRIILCNLDRKSVV